MLLKKASITTEMNIIDVENMLKFGRRQLDGERGRVLKRHFLMIVIFFTILLNLHSQEVLLSDTEQYYDSLAIQGAAERSYINYRTLSDSRWMLNDRHDHVWKDSLPQSHSSVFDIFRLRIYGPELYTSFNSATPNGQNDGVLWQGRGLNSRFSAGIRLEGYGLELTLKPDITFSQNRAFDLVSPASEYSGSSYDGKASLYGYYGITFVDAPQRFGKDPFFNWSWGDSEIRYTWKAFTAGFGTQLIWLGPARINPIIHSNNAAPYPKIDLGVRRTALNIPFLGGYLGDIEARAFWGKLTESDYFDNDPANDNNLLTGLSVSYAPSFAPGFSIGFHRTMLSKWSDYDYSALFTLIWPFMSASSGSDERDQRASLTASYEIPQAGFLFYLEWARDDFSSSYDRIVRYPFHTQAYTLGGVKQFNPPGNSARGEINIEITNLESSRDYELLNWVTSFYRHHIITQGYTNQGQWLGAGMGMGGNSQYIGLKLYYKNGFSRVFLQRTNPDNDYIWFMNKGKPIAEKRDDEYKFKTILSLGIERLYFINSKLSIKGQMGISDIHNPLYESDPVWKSKSKHLINVFGSIFLNYQL